MLSDLIGKAVIDKDLMVGLGVSIKKWMVWSVKKFSFGSSNHSCVDILSALTRFFFGCDLSEQEDPQFLEKLSSHCFN